MSTCGLAMPAGYDRFHARHLRGMMSDMSNGGVLRDGLRLRIANRIWRKPPAAGRNSELGRIHLHELCDEAHAWCVDARPQMIGIPTITIDYCRAFIDLCACNYDEVRFF
jgi:hypothetical protein